MQRLESIWTCLYRLPGTGFQYKPTNKEIQFVNFVYLSISPKKNIKYDATNHPESHRILPACRLLRTSPELLTIPSEGIGVNVFTLHDNNCWRSWWAGILIDPQRITRRPCPMRVQFLNLSLYFVKSCDKCCIPSPNLHQ